MKKILGLTVAALMVMGLVGGGTWAYFSDTETIGDSQFLAGTLDLGLATTNGTNPVDSISATFSTTNFAPGDTKSASIFVNNSGSIAMTSVNMTFSNTAVVNGTPVSVDAGPGGDTDNLLKMIKLTDLKFGDIGSPADIATYDGHDITQLASDEVALGPLGATTEKELFVEFTFDPTATNGCQGDSANITITFTGLQQ
jgi:predicted ribosomally synthesized peptide with SipW-like signal peptide